MPFTGYRITSPYGFRVHPIQKKMKFHAGIDLVKTHKEPITAFVAGQIVHAGWGEKGSGFGGYGNVVAIKDSNGYLHCYCHLDGTAVSIGAKVYKGQIIGFQGDTPKENVTESHLHYEIRKKPSPSFGYTANPETSTVDPTRYLRDFYTVSKPATATPTASNGRHVVKQSDTLSGIAKIYNTTMEELVEVNNIKNKNLITVGQNIKLPNAPQKETYHTVVMGDTVSALAKRYGCTVSHIKSWNRLADVDLIGVGLKLRVR